MRQTAFTVLTPILPDRLEALGHLLDAIGNDINDNPHLRFSQFDRLHYASFVTVVDGVQQPYLLFEGNVDGPAKVVLRQLLEMAGPSMDAIYAHCVGYPAAGAADLGAALGYLRSHDIGANTFFLAWPGRRVSDICAEQGLRDRIEAMLDEEMTGAGAAERAPADIRAALQRRVRADPALHWAQRAPRRPFLVRHGKKILSLLTVQPLAGAAVVVTAALGHAPTRWGRLRARLL
ncbi:MAG: hypothetical protein ACRDZW_01510, partial [Acidimicrobiales bacterium]